MSGITAPNGPLGEVLRLTTGKVAFDLRIETAARPWAAATLAATAGVFRPRAAGVPPDVVFRLAAFPPGDPAVARVAVEPFALRRSSAAPFNLDLSVGRLAGGRRVGLDRTTGTALLADPDTRTLTLYLSEASGYHLIETLRYTLLVAEQAAGTLILHASAAAREDGAWALVLGDKGRGKTTTLLHLIRRAGFRYVSGDKVLADLRDDGRPRLRAWPDYPHVGLGTLGQFPDLAAACGVALTDAGGAPRPPGEKVLIRPERYVAALGGQGPVETDGAGWLIFPDVAAPESGIAPVAPAAERRRRLAATVEDARIFTPGIWHGLLNCPAPVALDTVFAGLDRARWLDIRGKSVELAAALAPAPAA